MRTFIFLLCSTVFALSPKLSLSQERVTIDVDKQVSVDEVFTIIREQTDYSFIYQKGMFDNLPLVQLKKGVIRVTSLLKKSLPRTDFNYIVTGNNTILIKKKSQSLQRQVSGTVTDANGAPIPNASVQVKGTTRGVATDFDGVYSILVPDPASVLVFSSLGFETQEITVGTQSTINVTLEESVSKLDEVVLNAGYYKTEKKVATGSILKVDAKEIARQPITNPLQALQGRTAGVLIQQNTGVPGGSFTVEIRGRNSINSGNDPFYIVDGVPYVSSLQSANSPTLGQTILLNPNPLNAINPSDIESIEILKGADATAIYGSRGANGVVLITTKKGSQGKTTVDLNISTALSSVGSRVDVLNTPQYLEMRREAFQNDGVEPTVGNAPDLLLWDSSRNTDWQDELIGGTAETINVQTSVSGGNENTQFRIAGGLFRETTVFPGDFRYRRISGSMNLNHTSQNKKFQASLSTTISSETNNLFRRDITFFALSLPPNVPDFFDENGNLIFPEGSSANPYAALESKYNNTFNNLVTNGVFSYMIHPDVRLKSSFGYTQIRRDEINSTPESAIDPAIRAFREPETVVRNSNFETIIFEPQIEFNKSFGKAKVNVLVGSTLQESTTAGTSILASGFITDSSLENIGAASETTVQDVDDIDYRYLAFFGRINFNWDNRYILNIVGRRDGSSRFGPGNRFDNFGSLGFAWNFAGEKFVKSSTKNVVSTGKLRASYGVTGNDQIGDYQYLNSYRLTRLPYQGVPGFEPSRLFNPNFTWERNKKFEVGIDLGFFKDRIFIASTFFRNRSDNQLVGIPLPQSVGFRSFLGNLPALVENRGWEFEFVSRNIDSKKFSWTSSFNLTIPRNELLEFPNLEESTFANSLEIGRDLSLQRLFRNTGVDPETGVYTFEDLDDDGNISNPNDLQGVGELRQDFFGGIQNNLRFNGLELDFLFQFVRQTGNSFFQGYTIPPGFLGNQPVQVLDRWQEPGDLSNIQRFTQTFGPAGLAYFFNVGQSNLILTDASFIRLKNLSISYNLDSKITEKLNLDQFRIYVQGQNLLTFTDFVGLDPESQNVAILPPLRTISTGIQITF